MITLTRKKKGGDRTKKLIPIGTIILIAGVAISAGTWIWLRIHPWPMMTFLAWLFEHPSMYLGLALTFLGLFTLYRANTNTVSWLGLTTGIVITFLIIPSNVVLIIGIAVILIGLAGLMKTRRKEVTGRRK